MAERLFQPLKFGSIRLAHRIALAPLTRFRADENHVPKRPIVAEYYAQRASVPGTLLITEATFISPQAGGYDYVPGIWNQEQVSAWKEVTDAVHSKGSFIFCQLWALGRVADPKVLAKTGHRPVSSSAIAVSPEQEPPVALTEDGIQEYIEQYVHAAKNAIAAGFDGVEIHGANGYLLDQFLQDVINQRTDRWGGSVENRSRFHLEVTKAVISAVGKERVGVRLNPFTQFQPGNVRMKNPVPQFTHVIKELKALDIAFLDLIEPRVAGKGPVDGVYASSEERQLDYCLKAWGPEKPVLVAGGYTADKARQIVDAHYKDYEVIVAFGRLYISTPDLPFRVQKGIDLNPYNRKTFYTHDAEGYTDYPFSKEFTSISKM